MDSSAPDEQSDEADPKYPAPVLRRWRAIFTNIIHPQYAAAGVWLRGLVGSRILPNLRDYSGQRAPVVWLLSLVIGCGVAYAAILFRMLIGLIQYIWLGTTSERVYATAADLPWLVLLLAPVCGGLIVGFILHRFMPGRRAQSVADVIEARAIKDCKLPVQSGLWSALVAVISLGFGASAGREGPVVHLGATIASALEDYFNLSPGARRMLLAAGVAAAVSASFNAPIAGVLFAHEVILAHFAISAFVPLVIASVSATVIARLHLGNFPAFIIPDYQITSFLEFPAFALLGVTCAVVAILFEFALLGAGRAALRVAVPLWLRPALAGLMVGLIAIFFPQVLGVGYDATDMALKQQFPLALLLALIVAKTAATAITLAGRFGGGVFSPALYLGAMTGCAFGIIATAAFPEIGSSYGLYAILGMGGVAAAVLGAPISTTLIIFELTGGYDMTIALLLTVSISNGLTQAVMGASFFHWQLSNRGLSLQEGPHKEIMRQLIVRDFMQDLSAEEASETLLRAEDDLWLQINDTVEQALRAFDRSGQRRIAVVGASDTEQIVGWAVRVDALQAFNQALIASHVEEHR